MDRRKDRCSFGAKNRILTVQHLAFNKREHRDETPLAFEDRPTATPSRGNDLWDSPLRIPGNCVCPFEFRARSPGWARMQNELASVRLDEQDKGLIATVEPCGRSNIDTEESLGSVRQFGFSDQTYSQSVWVLNSEWANLCRRVGFPPPAARFHRPTRGMPSWSQMIRAVTLSTTSTGCSGCRETV